MLLLTLSICGVLSSLLANMLGFLRVVALWGKEPHVVFGLSVVVVLTSLATIGSVTAACIILRPYIQWSELGQLCSMTKSSLAYTGVWAAPMGFELVIIALTGYNALSRPRDSRKTLTLTLRRDGILYFVSVALVRGVSVIFSLFGLGDPKFASFASYLSWALVSLATSRLVIHIRSSERSAALNDECNAIISLSTFRISQTFPTTALVTKVDTLRDL